jgi:outer membrane protein assembly factor BamB
MPLLPPAVLWTAVLDQNIAQPLLVFGQTLLIASQPSGQMVQHGRLDALNLADGSPRWQHPFQYALVTGMQAYYLPNRGLNVAVVATSSSDFMQGQGGLFAFDETGNLIWQSGAKEQSYSAPLVMGRQVYVTAGSQNLLTITPAQEGDDEQRISLPVKASQAAPAIHDGIAYIPCRSPELLTVELSGDVRWQFKFQAGNREWLDKTPLVSEDMVYTGSSLGTLFALERDNGKLVWQVKIGDKRPLSDLAFAGGVVYVGKQDGLAAVDGRNGRILWTFNTERPISAAPLVFYDTIYCTSEDHFFYALDRENGSEMWRHEMERRIEVPPVLTAAALLVADRGGAMVAFSPPAIPQEPKAEILAPETILAQKRAEAEGLEAQNAHLPAAYLWHELGELERAAQQLELAEAWPEAAKIWLQLDRYSNRAFALEQHAITQAAKELTNEEKATAWEQAAHAYAESGEKEKRLHCEQEVARYRQMPLLNLEIETEPMVINAWSKLNFTVRNEGFGVARHLVVHLKDGRFEGQSGRTQTIITLQPQRDYRHWLDICPREHGPEVPLQLVIEYVDKAGNQHHLERTSYVAVAGETVPLTGELPVVDTTEMLVRLPMPDGRNPLELRDKIVQYFDKEELLSIILELGLNEDEFEEKLSPMAKELIFYLARRNRVGELLDILRRERDFVEW